MVDRCWQIQDCKLNNEWLLSEFCLETNWRWELPDLGALSNGWPWRENIRLQLCSSWNSLIYLQNEFSVCLLEWSVFKHYPMAVFQTGHHRNDTLPVVAGLLRNSHRFFLNKRPPPATICSQTCAKQGANNHIMWFRTQGCDKSPCNWYKHCASMFVCDIITEHIKAIELSPSAESIAKCQSDTIYNVLIMCFGFCCSAEWRPVVVISRKHTAYIRVV